MKVIGVLNFLRHKPEPAGKSTLMHNPNRTRAVVRLFKNSRYVVLFTLFFCAPSLIWAQHRDSFFFDSGYNFRGYFFDLGYSLNLGRPYDAPWRFTVEGYASHEEFKLRGETVPVNSGMAMVSINHDLNGLLRETFLPSWQTYLGLGALCGSERVNNDRKYLADGARIINESKWVYGFFANISFQIPLFSDRTDIYLRLIYKPFYLLNSDVGNFVHNLGAGMVFKIN